MNTKQWNIYNFIKERSLESKWTKQQDIIDYFSYKFNENISKRSIRKNINEIRKDDIIQKIILTDYSKGYRLMSKEEELDYLKKRKISILKMLKQYYKDVKRYEKNNQTRIIFGKYERNCIESLIDIENNNDNERK